MHSSLLVCTVPCPINDKETDFLYDSHNLAFSFLYLPLRNGREFILQSGDITEVVMLSGSFDAILHSRRPERSVINVHMSSRKVSLP
jgi:hypothetical protein